MLPARMTMVRMRRQLTPLALTLLAGVSSLVETARHQPALDLFGHRGLTRRTVPAETAFQVGCGHVIRQIFPVRQQTVFTQALRPEPLQAPRGLAAAQNTERRQILNDRKSLVELERRQKTTLSNLNITVLSAAGAVQQ